MTEDKIKINIIKNLDYKNGNFEYTFYSIVHLKRVERFAINHYGDYVKTDLTFSLKSVDAGSSYKLYLEKEKIIELSTWLYEDEVEKKEVLKFANEVQDLIRQFHKAQTLWENDYEREITFEGSISDFIDKYS